MAAPHDKIYASTAAWIIGKSCIFAEVTNNVETMKCNVGTIKKWDASYSGLLGGVVYIIISEWFPEWRHTIAGLFVGAVSIGTYLLLPKKLGVLMRLLISIAVTIGVAAIIRFGFY